ncbi:MAG TPA: sigma factor-like helix-turn-helix DNA-binding protein, partial [Bacillales bacterium]|nr:sigma factor-like helix-turn-helix DNA-binding protein [Bacillales bacterium]
DRIRRQRFEVPIHEEDVPGTMLEDFSTVEIRELLSTLPPELKDVVHKRYWLGLNSQQIAEPLGITASTVRYRLHTAVRMLRSTIDQ